ncbi:MAG: beta-propeller fold lactonase family protein [Phycisphaerales bacterium]
MPLNTPSSCAARRVRRSVLSLCGLGIAAFGVPAVAQPVLPTLIVANNGNVEGTITTFTLNDDDTLTFIGEYDAATNPNAIALSPGGSRLAVGRASSAPVTQDLRVYPVNPDGSLAPPLITQTPKTPLDLAWVDDSFLAVLRTNIEGGLYSVLLYELDDAGLTLRDEDPLSAFASAVEVHPGRPFVYVSESSGGNRIRVYRFTEASKSLTEIQTVNTPAFPLGLSFSTDGRFLYAGGGISGGGNAVLAYEVQENGTLVAVPGSPFASGGSSPFTFAGADDGSFLFAGHGTDATVRTLAVDPDGALAYTGNFFDVGLQGSLGSIVSTRDLMIVTDETTAIDGIRGVYVFRFDEDGAFTQVGPVYDTQGITPEKMVLWVPPVAPECPGDVNGDLVVDSDDLGVLLGEFGCSGAACTADLNDDGSVDSDDLGILLSAFGADCN